MRNSFVSTVALGVAVTVAGPIFDQGLLRAGSPARRRRLPRRRKVRKRLRFPPERESSSEPSIP